MHPDVAVLKFLDEADADLETGGLRDVEAYVRRFPAHAERIRAEFGRLLEPGRDEADRTSPRWIGGRYRVLESLGRGGFGEVFLAEDSRLARRVAIKVLAGLRALSDEWRARLIREAEATNKITDDGLCPVYDLGFEDGAPFLVMPWIPGRSLDRILAASAARGEPPIQLGEVGSIRQRRDAFVRLVERLARTLHTAHEAGIVHRDVKPANILVRPDGRPVLIDFGLAWLESADEVLSRSGALGTPAYSAPEVLRGGRVAPDPRLDVWSLGAVLFEGLALRRPFSARPGASLERSVLEAPAPRFDPVLGRDLQAVVETALARRPEDRYATMAAFADDLGRVWRGEAVQVRPAGPLRRLRAWARLRPGLVALGLAGIAILLTVLFVAASLWARGRERAVVARVATTLAEQMDGILRENDQLSRVGFAVEARSARAEQLLETIRLLREGLGAAPEVERSLARVLLASAGLHLRLGVVETASDRIQEALGMFRELHEPGTQADEDLASTSRALVLLGDAHFHLARFDRALEQYEAALEIDLLLLAERTDDARRTSDVGFGHLRIGAVEHRTGHLAAALADKERAVAMLRRAEALEPGRLDRRGHTAEAMLEVVDTLFELDAPLQDIRARVEEIERRAREQTERFPRDSQAWTRLFSAVGKLCRLTERPAERLVLTGRMVDCAVRARDIEGDAPYPNVVLSGALRKHADVLLELDRVDEARATVEAAVGCAARAFAGNPDVEHFVAEYVHALIAAARTERRLARPRAAGELIQAAVACAENAWGRADAGAEERLQLAMVLLTEDVVDRDRARRALEVLDGMAENSPGARRHLVRLRALAGERASRD